MLLPHHLRAFLLRLSRNSLLMADGQRQWSRRLRASARAGRRCWLMTPRARAARTAVVDGPRSTPPTTRARFVVVLGSRAWSAPTANEALGLRKQSCCHHESGLWQRVDGGAAVSGGRCPARRGRTPQSSSSRPHSTASWLVHRETWMSETLRQIYSPSNVREPSVVEASEDGHRSRLLRVVQKHRVLARHCVQ